MSKKVNLQEIEKIARSVRSWAEGIWRKEDDVQSFSLLGCCVIAAAKLMQELHRAGYDAVTHITNYHGYVCVGKYVVDVTATQFNFEDEVLIKPKNFFTNRFDRNSLVSDAYGLLDMSFVVLEDVDAIIDHQEKTGWCSSQCVSRFKGEFK